MIKWGEYFLEFILDVLNHFKNEIIVFLFATLPIIELRGAIPLGLAFKMNFMDTFIFAVLGNTLSIPFAFLFIRRVLNFMRKFKLFKHLVENFEDKIAKKAESVKKYTQLGLLIFVAIPLPGTGAWTGAFIAAFLEMRLKDAFWPISLGVIIAGIIVTGVAYGFLSFLSFLV